MSIHAPSFLSSERRTRADAMTVLAVVPEDTRSRLAAALAAVQGLRLLNFDRLEDALAAVPGEDPLRAWLLVLAVPAGRIAEPGVEAQLRHCDAMLCTVLLCTDAETRTDAGISLPTHPERLLSAGLQDLLQTRDLHEGLGPRLQLALARRKLARCAPEPSSTDGATGLPTRQQLVEHMHHLVALREREPAPMGIIVLRIEGLHAAVPGAADGASASLLRRKIAVRLRSVLRASDVVASLAGDAFGVLLSAIDRDEHVERVADKLLSATRRPFSVGGQAQAVSCAAGVRVYPRDGGDAGALLQAAALSARSTRAAARGGIGPWPQPASGAAPAANDE